MNTRELIVLTSLCILSTNAFGAATTIIISDGDDLAGAIASASHGSTIEIHSNDTFVTDLSWSHKYLTIEAAEGYRPTIQGSIIGIKGSNRTGAALTGLNVTGGISVDSTGTTYSTLRLTDLTIGGNAGFGGTGEFRIDVDSRNCQYNGTTIISGTSDFSFGGYFEGNTFADDILMSTLTDARIRNTKFYENDFQGRVISQSIGPDRSLRQYTFDRNWFQRGLELVSGTYSTLEFTATNNLFGRLDSDTLGNETGFELRTGQTQVTVDGEFVNNTIVGFATGIDVTLYESSYSPDKLSLSFVNMLLDNMDDIKNFDIGTIYSSLISDGTFAGTNGNFGGQPILGLNGRLLTGSIGIDRGNNAVASDFDFAGNPRVLDGDLDGIPVIDVGAFEYMVPEPASIWCALAGCLLTMRWLASPNRLRQAK
ncbi:choice-of-anchor Q domain-containing protein [Aeoliella mucimassa]|uniref:PEP-CTERM protein-sorting domain-containing protein n=1 Tax=Aeoliella mucimassa TaxID=2527972 RepID=A0A518AU89_9BACT|nr:choice-of-anchor Q domain-containing protein [Aeoliella mucimassa]QDU58255.1 hypothetical protein Pan181_44880 [Aeoliella mucimassa]